MVADEFNEFLSVQLFECRYRLRKRPVTSTLDEAMNTEGGNYTRLFINVARVT